MPNTYDIGDVARLSAGPFRDSAGVIADPTTVVCSVIRFQEATDATAPAATEPSVIKDSVGNYHADFVCTEAGHFGYRFEGTGAVQTAEEATFFVRASYFDV